MPRRPLTPAVVSRGEGQSHLEDLWDEPAPSPRPSRCVSIAEALQGAWLSTVGRRQAKLLVCGERMTVHFRDGDIYMGRFSLGVNGRSFTLDVRVDEGPPRHRGLVALGIFELDGDRLRWCTASPGQVERPTAFAEQHPLHLSLEFRRERPATRDQEPGGRSQG